LTVVCSFFGAMEFKFVDGKWTRRELKNSTEFRIVTRDGNIVKIHNFIETKTKLLLTKYPTYDGDISKNITYLHGFMPRITPEKYYEFRCDILTGEWIQLGSSFGTKRFKHTLLKLMNKLDKLDKRFQLLSDVIAPKVLQQIVCAYL